MATDRARRQLKHEINIVRGWDLDRNPAEVESSFLHLMDLDQQQHIDLWDELREALARNDDLRHPEVLKFLDRTDLAEEGYWWYDPGQWTPVQA